MIKLYKTGQYFYIDRGAGNVQQWPLAGDYLIQTVQGYVFIWSMDTNDFGEKIPFRILYELATNIVDELGDPIPGSITEYLNIQTQPAPGMASTGYKYIADNYAGLPATADLYDLAYARYAQGTAWLPGPIGGTYYPDGSYMWDGTKWISDENAIAVSLQDLYERDAAAILQADAMLLQMSGIQDEIDAHEVALSDMSSDMADLMVRTADNEIDIATLKGQFITLSGQMATAQGQIATLQTQYSTLSGQYTTLSGQVSTLAGQLSSLTTVVGNKADTIDARFPTTAQKAALAGTNGSPSGSNLYVTNSDPRNTNARTPLAHTHVPSEVGLSLVQNLDQRDPNNITQDATHRFATDALISTWNAKQNALGFTPENAANKNLVNGYAGLDGAGMIPAALLPSYVDDVLEFANVAAFPAVGATGKIYTAIDTGFVWRWSGTIYVRIAASPGTTDALAEGVTNLYFTAARVLATLLSGLSIPASSAIAAGDTILAALGKLQAQINAHTPLLPTSGQKDALAGNNGTPSTLNKYVTETGLAASLQQNGTAVSRPINSTGFAPSATKYTRADYVVQMVCTTSIAGSQASDFFLEISPSPFTTWTIVDQQGFGYGGALVIGLTLASTLRLALRGVIPPAYQARIRNTGTGTNTYISGRENIIG